MNVRYLAAPALLASTLVLGACSPTSGTTGDAQAIPTTEMPTAAMATEAQAVPTMIGGAPTPNAAAAHTAAEAFVDGGPRFVSAAALAEALDSGQYDIQVVDSRAAENFGMEHIPGAVNVPYFEPEKHVDQLSKEKWIVTYCECPHAEAEQVANYLENNGYTKVRVIDEGLQGWKALGKQTVSGTS